jgi:hypothetical protein
MEPAGRAKPRETLAGPCILRLKPGERDNVDIAVIVFA